MATTTIWKGVSVAMQSALAASKTITAITKANPGVCSSTSHGFTNGDYLLITAQGMSQVNQRVFRVSAASANDFALEGEDTTAYDTFSSGGAQKITFGTSITTLTSVGSSGGEADQIDATTIHDLNRTILYGLPSAVAFSFDSIWDPSDAGLLALKTASIAQGSRAFKFQFGTGGKILLFYGMVSAGLSPGGSAQGLVTTPIQISAVGAGTTYAS